MYGAAAGAFFDGLAIMVDTASSRTSNDGYEGLLEGARRLVPLAGVAVLGIGGMVLTQLSFQIELGAPLPANLAVDPLVAVLLGVALPHDRVPISAPRIAVHGLCRAAVVAVRLANPDHEALSHPDEVSVAG